MKRLQLLLTVVVFTMPAAHALANGRGFVSVGVNVGPGCRPWGCGPWYGGCGWYRPFPLVYYGVYVPPPAPRVIVQPAPVVVQPAPAVVQPAPLITETAPPPESSPVAPRPVAPAITSVSVVSRGEPPAVATDHLKNLADPDEGVRQTAAIELGRMHAEQALDALAATLAGDASPGVRDAAARALGLLGSPRALPALTRAAQADSDRDVRRSAQFAVEIIHAQMRQR